MSKINVTSDLVQHVANLARIKLEESEVKEYQALMQSLLDYFENLDQVKTEGLSPLMSPTQRYQKNLNALREDHKAESLDVQEILKNTASQGQRQFKINSVIEES